MKFVIALCFLVVGFAAVAVNADAPDADSRAVTADIKDEVEAEMKTKYTDFILIDYKKKTDKKGTTYVLKVKTNNSFLHVQVFQSKNGKNEKVKVKAATRTSPLNFF